MGRPRKPTTLLAINGGLDKNPGRYADRAHEPVEQRALGPAPGHLEPKAQLAWSEIERIAPEGVLTHADRLAVEMAAVLLAQFRRAGELMPIPALTRLQSLLGDLGLSPAARSKVSVFPAKPSAGRFTGIGKRPD